MSYLVRVSVGPDSPDGSGFDTVRRVGARSAADFYLRRVAEDQLPAVIVDELDGKVVASRGCAHDSVYADSDPRHGPYWQCDECGLSGPVERPSPAARPAVPLGGAAARRIAEGDGPAPW